MTTLSHGHAKRGSKTPTYRIWSYMLKRCGNPKFNGFKYYGGRGIHVCDRWKSFANFLADMGERPKGLTLDRRDTNGNYEPGNCRWATRAEQVRNRRPRALCSQAGAKSPTPQTDPKT